MPRTTPVRLLALLLVAPLLLLALPLAAGAAPDQGSKRYLADMFPLMLSDELQGPLLGPVKKATLRAGESWWAVTFAPDGKPLSREQYIPGLTHEIILYEGGRAVKRIENPGTDKQGESRIRYDGNRAYKVEYIAKDGKPVEVSSGALSPQGLVTARTIKFGDGVTVYDVNFEYSPAGLPVRETGRLTKRGTATIERVYDKNGRILSRTQTLSPQPDGPPTATGLNKLEYRYDLKGQLTEAHFQADNPPAAVAIAIQGEYDQHGNWTKLTMTRRDAAGQQPAQPQIFTQEIEYHR